MQCAQCLGNTRNWGQITDVQEIASAASIDSVILTDGFFPVTGMSAEAAPAQRLSVAIVEDDDDTRAWIAGSVSANPELRLVAQYAGGEDAIAGMAKVVPEVLLVDLGLPDISGLEVIRFVAANYPDCDVLVFSTFGDDEHVLPALEAGARGFLLKGALTRDITHDIHALSHGGSPLSPIIARQVLKRLRPEPSPATDEGADGDAGKGPLTPREIEILRMIARGFSYTETAGLLGISAQTVHTHLKRIYRKLAVHSKTEAVFEADRRQLI